MGNREIFEQLLRQSDPYAPYAGAVNSLNFRATKPGQESTAIGVGFAKAILAGLLKGKSDRHRIDQTALTNEYLRGGEAEGLDEIIRTGLDRQRISDQQERAAKKKDALELKFWEDEMGEPGMRRLFQEKFGLGSDNSAAALPSALTSEGDRRKELTALGYRDKDIREILRNERDFKRTQEQDERSYEKDQIDRINRLPSVVSLRNTTKALGQLSNITDINTSTADIPFATIFIGGLDGSVVREGEYDRVGGSNPLLNKFKNQLESTLNGKSGLGVNIKKQMYQELRKMQQGLQKEAEREVAPYQEMFKKREGSDLSLPFQSNYEFADPFQGKKIPISELSDAELLALQ